MAIRIREIKGCTVALCAAETKAKKGDIYLDDNAHHALTTKFAIDWKTMFPCADLADSTIAKLMKREEAKEE